MVHLLVKKVRGSTDGLLSRLRANGLLSLVAELKDGRKCPAAWLFSVGRLAGRVLDPLRASSTTFRPLCQRRLSSSWILCVENDRPSQIYHPTSSIASMAFFRSTSA